uniref:Uncharacterized protein n=1 Tax=Panagrolaimus sp. PS1159 TaxID=55785 RepID=A0AC35EWI1_9BILA
MSKRFEGKVVIVTGSSAGIGRAAILRFAKEGASVVIHGQSKEKLDSVKAELLNSKIDESKILVIPGSLQDEAVHDRLINETVKHFGKLDILINNAGIPGKSGVDSNSMEGYDAIMAVNVRAVYRLIQLAAPHLEKTKGSIVNISSSLSQCTLPMSIPYSISKAALDHLTRNYARLLAEKGICVNSVNPGLTATDFGVQMIPKEMLQNLITEEEKKIPFKRASTSDEQAEVILNIASPTNTYMTGSIVFNDGGYLISH